MRMAHVNGPGADLPGVMKSNAEKDGSTYCLVRKSEHGLLAKIDRS